MFEPRIPVNPAPTGEIIPVITTAAQTGHPHAAQTGCSCHHPTPAPTAAPARPSVQVTPATVLTGAVVVLVVGAVLVSMLLAVAITAASLAVCALVIRSLLASNRKGR
ncbi:SpdD-like protein [Streptomyces venezuelae]|uniref:SpdD-like protein n=1 Tax=Streptomyces venezuelae TaxID=54571 RepID=UPI0037A465E1